MSRFWLAGGEGTADRKAPSGGNRAPCLVSWNNGRQLFDSDFLFGDLMPYDRRDRSAQIQGCFPNLDLQPQPSMATGAVPGYTGNREICFPQRGACVSRVRRNYSLHTTRPGFDLRLERERPSNTKTRGKPQTSRLSLFRKVLRPARSPGVPQGMASARPAASTPHRNEDHMSSPPVTD